MAIGSACRCTSIQSSSQLYDPALGLFLSTADLGSLRVYHTATLLPNGRVLIAGGSAAGNTSLASARLDNDHEHTGQKS